MRTLKINLKDEFAFLGENDANPTLEVILPYNMREMNRQNQKRPCMVICPGGGYGMVSERESEPIGHIFLPLGFNVFILKYSVTPHRYPTQLNEVAATFELIKKNAEEWNCDIEKIAIIGFSAGGHLAAHYSNAYYSPEVTKNFPESIRPFATILAYPVITAIPETAHEGSIKNLYGKTVETEEEINKFSCERLVTDDTPPAFIWTTSQDDCVPPANSLLYADALIKHKIPVELHVYPYGWHGLSTVDYTTNDRLTENIERAADWTLDLRKWIKMTF